MFNYISIYLCTLTESVCILPTRNLISFSISVNTEHSFRIYVGIHVLRILKYDRQALAMRRLQCENVDADPIVWTNQRFIRWARSIDLGEYADNLKGTQTHKIIPPDFI